MMTIRTMLGSAIALALIAGTAAGQNRGGVFGVVTAGPAIPMGSFREGFKTGYGLSAGIGAAIRNAPVEIRGMVHYGSFGAEGGEGSSKPLAVTADAIVGLGPRDANARPYLVGGVGFHSFKYSSGYSIPGGEGGGYGERDSSPSVGAGAGVLFGSGRARVFVEGRYVAVTGSGHSHLPLSLGVRLGR